MVGAGTRVCARAAPTFPPHCTNALGGNVGSQNRRGGVTTGTAARLLAAFTVAAGSVAIRAVGVSAAAAAATAAATSTRTAPSPLTCTRSIGWQTR